MPVAGNIYLYIVGQKPGAGKADALRLFGDGKEGVLCFGGDDDDRAAQHGKTDVGICMDGVAAELLKKGQDAELIHVLDSSPRALSYSLRM